MARRNADGEVAEPFQGVAAAGYADDDEGIRALLVRHLFPAEHRRYRLERGNLIVIRAFKVSKACFGKIGDGVPFAFLFRPHDALNAEG